MNDTFSVEFKNIKWEVQSSPTACTKHIRRYFLIDQNDELFGESDLKDILACWLYDEFNDRPIDFEFKVSKV